MQGACCASAINVSKSKPEVFGLSIAPAAIVEGFAVFAFVFALVVSAGIPGVAPVSFTRTGSSPIKMTEKEQSSGVQELIDRLREKGVEEGKEQAEQLSSTRGDGPRRCSTRLARRPPRSSSTPERRRTSLRAAGDDALRLAGRDAVLALKEEVSEQFAKQVRRLVSDCLRDEQFMQRLILEIAGRAVPKDSKQPLEFLLPEDGIAAGRSTTPHEGGQGRHPEPVRAVPVRRDDA